MKLKKRGFISEIDQMLVELRQQQPLTLSQAAEQKKYQKIVEMRDNKNARKDEFPL